MKHVVFIGCLLLAGAMVTVSCQKERPVSTTDTAQVSKTPASDPPIEMLTQSKTISYTDPNCTLAGGRMCNIRGGIGCLLRFPLPEEPDFGPVSIQFYAPVATGQGTTGTQMAMVLLSEGYLLETVLGPEESDEPVIPVYHELAQHLNCSAIEVINQPYTPVYTPEFPYGYVVLDCVAHQVVTPVESF